MIHGIEKSTIVGQARGMGPALVAIRGRKVPFVAFILEDEGEAYRRIEAAIQASKRPAAIHRAYIHRTSAEVLMDDERGSTRWGHLMEGRKQAS